MTDLLYSDVDRFPHETIDDETVLIDVARGHLFLFSGTGPWLWQRCMAGATIDALVADEVARYGQPAAEPTRRFLEQLAEESLLRPGPPPSEPPAATHPAERPAEFVAPVVERYDEISDIIAMDPIHEVNPARGWPHRRDDTS